MKAKALLEAMYDNRTLIYGHRGAMAYAPMNTLEAFQLALDQGADGVELDVQLSKDRYPVIVHDFTVDHTTDTTGLVKDFTLAELKALDAGGWFSDSFRGAQVPTLDEVFETVGHSLIINVELKALGEETDGLEDVVAETIRRHNLAERVLVSSFNPPTLKRFRALMPDVPIGYLYYPDFDTRAMMEGFSYEAYHPHFELIDESTVRAAREAGHILNTWTVNDTPVARTLRDMGVQGIITNKPDEMISALGS